jgi:hypothetical protein
MKTLEEHIRELEAELDRISAPIEEELRAARQALRFEGRNGITNENHDSRLPKPQKV